MSILQGLSGTGKTSLPRVFAQATGAICIRIPVQSNWRDRHELLGYNNDFTRQFTETDFTKAVYEAGLPREQDRCWLIVLDEMNLARVEYYFADFLSALEEQDREGQVVSLLPFDPASQGESVPQHLNRGVLRIPPNLWFVGTANEDQSTYEITDKVYDRAQVIEFREPDPEHNTESVEPLFVRWSLLQEAFDAARQHNDLQLNTSDHEFISKLDRTLRGSFDLTFGHRIRTQMRTYVPVFQACGGTRSEGVDYFIARKVLQKVANRRHENIETALDALTETLENVPQGYGRMAWSLAAVEGLRLRLIGT
jgi:hypothetical protein